MEYQGNGNRVPQLVKKLEADLRNSLVRAVGRTDGYCQSVHACLLHKCHRFLHIGQRLITVYRIVIAHAHMAQLTLYGQTQGMADVYHFLYLLHIFLEGKGGTVDHDVGKTGADAQQALLKGLSMVQVQADLLAGTTGHLRCDGSKELHIRIRRRRHVQNQRRIHLLGCLDGRADIVIVIHIGGRYGIALCLCFCQYLI